MTVRTGTTAFHCNPALPPYVVDIPSRVGSCSSKKKLELGVILVFTSRRVGYTVPFGGPQPKDAKGAGAGGKSTRPHGRALGARLQCLALTETSSRYGLDQGKNRANPTCPQGRPPRSNTDFHCSWTKTLSPTTKNPAHSCHSNVV